MRKHEPFYGLTPQMGGDYAINGTNQWSGSSRWWITETVESFNGQRVTAHGNFVKWFSINAFGGTNYFCTPVGAVCHLEEPSLTGVNYAKVYFGLWASGKDFATCAWLSWGSEYMQAVGDPFVKK